eukprot:CAMPEP_0206401894 /NCGR_PEP_ID=MMETSP0294-20121207/26581_1 /ASSEMBLY_ACC=CAM_ASM_000327 /TAXON_ID=39354 /ORGANISM="Heterosigma akashiwo, Strain CCMP2393" /LENGTH=265 /DNA_ID=CAMNT_0053858761 /DNA_START=144 /DNA_END=941 /DNA_ORIENTATION=+
MKFVAMLLLSLIAHIAAWDTPSAYKQGPPQKVKIADVEVITLQKGRMTTGRRNSPVPQLECMGGCGDWTPDVVQCRNVGTDGVDANWKCDAEMPQGYRFGQIQVGCEGYDHPEDPYILPGSCQLMYELKGSQARGGAARTQQQQQQYQPQQGYVDSSNAEGQDSFKAYCNAADFDRKEMETVQLVAEVRDLRRQVESLERETTQLRKEYGELYEEMGWKEMEADRIIQKLEKEKEMLETQNWKLNQQINRVYQELKPMGYAQEGE